MYLVEVFDRNVNVCKLYKTNSKEVDLKLKNLPFEFFNRLRFMSNISWRNQPRREKMLAAVKFGKDSGDFALSNSDLRLSEILGVSIKIRRRIDGRYKMYKYLDYFSVDKLFE